jgi:CNP1-like family
MVAQNNPWLIATLFLAAASVCAQVIPPDPDWKELELAPPASFNKDGLVALEMPPYVSLKFGVDPASLTVSADGIVRYVVVATSSSGAVNALYEGLRCGNGEFKTYARWSASGKWTMATNPQWRPLNDNNTSHHALAFARQGACEGRTAGAASAADILRKMKTPVLSP